MWAIGTVGYSTLCVFVWRACQSSIVNRTIYSIHANRLTMNSVAMRPSTGTCSCNSPGNITFFCIQGTRNVSSLINRGVAHHSGNISRHSILTRSRDLATVRSIKGRISQQCKTTSAQREASTFDRRSNAASSQHSEDGVVIRPAQLSELEDVAWLRAEAYYEVQVIS